MTRNERFEKGTHTKFDLFVETAIQKLWLREIRHVFDIGIITVLMKAWDKFDKTKYAIPFYLLFMYFFLAACIHIWLLKIYGVKP